MPRNTFGTLFKIITWGESHGEALGVVIEGCPAGLPLSPDDINSELARRRPGHCPHVSPRKERDHAKILSGLFEGQTTGAPLSIVVENEDADSSKYEPIKDLLRPGHANYTYLEKYGVFDWRGGGRASARETAARVAAGAVAKQLLKTYDIKLTATLKQVGAVDVKGDQEAQTLIDTVMREGDSIGGVVELISTPLPTGLGEPLFDKLEALLAHAILSIPACKGIEFGAGFAAAKMRGKEHNDLFTKNATGKIVTKTNHAGGMLGGLSNGMPLVLRVAFKPTSSIQQEQETLSVKGEEATLKLPSGARHDPCVAVRAVPVVEAMTAIVLADALLLNRSSKVNA